MGRVFHWRYLKDIDGRALSPIRNLSGIHGRNAWPAIASECGEEALTKIANYEEGSFNNEGVLKALTILKKLQRKVIC